MLENLSHFEMVDKDNEMIISVAYISKLQLKE